MEVIERVGLLGPQALLTWLPMRAYARSEWLFQVGGEAGKTRNPTNCAQWETIFGF